MANKKIPMRQCVGCREMKPKKDMIRVLKTVATEESKSEILLDTTGRKNGRGAYICPNGACLKAAIKNKGLERSLKMPIPEDVYETLTKEMEEFETR
ncbi:MAG: RNase P modulator RnpM [Roseburia sp.]